jgi:hypothetical protein
MKEGRKEQIKKSIEAGSKRENSAKFEVVGKRQKGEMKNNEI